MQIAVCDDNKLHLLGMKEMIASLPIVENALYFSDLTLFLASIEDCSTYDAVLMDIDWGLGKTGMDAAVELYKRSPETRIIYVTGHCDRYFQHIFLEETNLSGFVKKPIDIEILEANLRKVADALAFNEQPALAVRQRGMIISIPYREIYYIESSRHTVTIHNAKSTVISYEQIGKVAQTLPAGFYQCHKSYIVNMRQIQRFQPGEIVLKNGKVIPVSRSKQKKAKEAYFKHIGKTLL